MKRTLIIIAAVLGMAVVASAQPKAIGGRVGNYGMDISYENYVGSGSDFLEFELGLDDAFSTNAFHFDGVYNFMIAHPDWTSSGQWGFYAGPGASVAVWDSGKYENVVYAGIVGVLKARFGIHEVITSIMLNWIALYFSNWVCSLDFFHCF